MCVIIFFSLFFPYCNSVNKNTKWNSINIKRKNGYLPVFFYCHIIRCVRSRNVCGILVRLWVSVEIFIFRYTQYVSLKSDVNSGKKLKKIKNSLSLSRSVKNSAIQNQRWNWELNSLCKSRAAARVGDKTKSTAPHLSNPFIFFF